MCLYWYYIILPVALKPAPTNEHAIISIAKHMIVSPNGIHRLAPFDVRSHFFCRRNLIQTWEKFLRFSEAFELWNCGSEIVDHNRTFTNSLRSTNWSNFYSFCIFLRFSVRNSDDFFDEKNIL